MVSWPAHSAWKVHRSIGGRIVEALIALILASTLGSRWYLPRWAAWACARSHLDPVTALSKIPWWLNVLLDDCATADTVVRACWGP